VPGAGAWKRNGGRGGKSKEEKEAG